MERAWLADLLHHEEMQVKLIVPSADFFNVFGPGVTLRHTVTYFWSGEIKVL